MKKLLLLIVAVLASLSSSATIPLITTTVTADVTALNGSGTKDSPFLITTADELTFFATQVNVNANVYEGKFVALDADIDMNGVSFEVIGKTIENSFAGTFDGKNYTISNLYITDKTDYVGLFGRTASTSVIKNLKINEIKISAVDLTQKPYPGAAYVGAVAGASLGVIDNCSVTTSKGIEGKDNVGGIVGLGVDVTNCVTKCDGSYAGVFSISGNAGGIVAYLTGKAEGNHNGSYVGTYSGTSASGTGGIVGYAANTAEILNNNNEGGIKGGYNTETPVGGIVGYSDGAYIHNNVNNGNITGSIATGGIAGCAKGGKIMLCENVAGVTSVTKNCAGIVGVADGSVQIADVVNSAFVQVYNSSQRKLGPNAGGIIGMVNGDTPTITNTMNTGEIYGTDCLGGIIGLGGGTLKGVVNTAGVYSYGASGGEGGAVGGLIGKATITTTINDAYSTGLLSTSAAEVSNLVADIDAGVSVTADNAYFTTDFGTPADTEIGTAITIAQLAAIGNTRETVINADRRASSSEVFDFGDNYTLPIIKSLTDVDAVRAEVAAVIVEEGNYNNCLGNLRISGLDGIKWMATVNDNVAEYIHFNPKKNFAYVTEPSNDEVEITATSGEYEKVWTVQLNVSTGITEIKDMGMKKIVGVKYYNVAGQVSDTEFEGVNIVITRYDDGTTRTVKVVH